MANLLRRLPPMAALSIIGVALTVLFVSVLWLAQRAGTNDDADTRQAAAIASAQTKLADVSALADNLQAGLEKANTRLRRNGAPTVPVPTAGTQGTDGTDGTDGATGAEGPRGARGPAGAAGSPGGDGSTGASGSDGTAGSPGPAGPTGPPGPQGPRGEPGAAGQDGQPGQNGQPGQPGADGEPPASFSFTDVLGVVYTCTDPDGDRSYTCSAS